MNIVLEVENIKCGGCANTIRNKLLQMPEVSSVNVSPEKGQVSLEAPESHLNMVKMTLHALGYPEVGTTKGVDSATAKAKSFVSCAIGRMSDKSPD